MLKKGFSKVLLIIVILVIVAGAVYGVIQLMGQEKQPEQSSGEPSQLEQAKEARIISAMSQIRTAAVLRYASEGSYADFNCANIEVADLCDEIKNQAGKDLIVENDDQSFCAYVELFDGQYYLINSNGFSGEVEPVSVSECLDFSENIENIKSEDSNNLQTYKDEENGFELQYSKEWALEPYNAKLPDGKAIFLKEGFASGFIVSVDPRDYYVSKYGDFELLSELQSSMRAKAFWEGGHELIEEDLEIDGLSAFVFKSVSPDYFTDGEDLRKYEIDWVQVYVLRGDEVFFISCSAGFLFDEFKQMLSTFRFLK